MGYLFAILVNKNGDIFNKYLVLLERYSYKLK